MIVTEGGLSSSWLSGSPRVALTVYIRCFPDHGTLEQCLSMKPNRSEKSVWAEADAFYIQHYFDTEAVDSTLTMFAQGATKHHKSTSNPGAHDSTRCRKTLSRMRCVL